MATITDLTALGYTCGIAHGDVATEQAALDAAQAAADPATVITQVNTLTSDTLQTLANIGKLPDTPEGKLELSAKIGAAALDMLTEHIDATVAFHQRALEEAQSMPDVWHVEGPGLAVYVSCKPDGTGWDDDQQAMLDALADPTGHAERCFQVDNPDAMQQAQQIAAAGVDITRAPGATCWEAEGRTFTAADLPGFLVEVQARPVPPTTAEKVAVAIAAAPELSDATKTALAAALAPPAAP